jgi:hypothetical protein
MVRKNFPLIFNEFFTPVYNILRSVEFVAMYFSTFIYQHL